MYKYSKINFKSISSNYFNKWISMNRIICIIAIGLLISSGISIADKSINETEYWGVVVVALDQSMDSYIYNSLLQKPNWNKDNIILLWKNNATSEKILNSIDWLIEKSDENDFVLFSVDAHGTYSNGDFGIWPSDGYENGILTVDELDNKFDRINSKGLCLIFDCCFAGNFVDLDSNILSIDKLKHNIFRKSIIEGFEDDNRVVIMGTMPNGLGCHWVDYDINGNIIDEVSPSTVIADVILDGNDVNNDGFTSAEEMYAYLKINYRIYALKGFLSIIIQLTSYLSYGFFVMPFPTVYDSYLGELPVVYN